MIIVAAKTMLRGKRRNDRAHQGIAHAGLAAKTYLERFKQMPKVEP